VYGVIQFGSVFLLSLSLLRNNFKLFPEFPEIIYGNCCCEEEMYIDILRRLSEAVRRKRLAKWTTSSSFLPHYNAAAHRSVFVKDFLARNVTTLQHSTYTPDLAAADLYMFPRLKSALKGQRLCVTTDIIKNATKELKRLSQNGFQEYFQHFYSRWEKCVVAQGDCFENSITHMIALFCISQK
jgi:hypothetical protein